MSLYNHYAPAIRRVFCYVALVTLTTLQFPCIAIAEETPTTPADTAGSVDIGEIIVREGVSKSRTPELDGTASGTVILPTDSTKASTTLPELMEQSSGVHVKRYGGLDDFSAVTLRGSTSSEVQIYLDDVPLMSASGEGVDLSLIPVAAIERIEVYRGGSPGSVADATAGGVIVIRTKLKPKETRTYVSANGGSFSTYKWTFGRAQGFDKISFIAGFERSQSAGDFPYLDNNGTTFNSADDQIAIRQNNDFASNTLYSKLSFNLPYDSNLQFQNFFMQKNQGIPGLGNRQSLNARLTDWRNLTTLAFDKNFSADALKFHADAFFDFLKDRFRDPDNEIGLGVEDTDDDTYRFGEHARLSYIWGPQNLKGLVAHRFELYSPYNAAASPAKGANSRRNTVSAGIEDEVTLFGDRLTISPSLRFTTLINHFSGDSNDPNFTNDTKNYQLSAKFGLSARLWDELYFKGNFYRGFRNPTFSELFGDRGTIVGNPELSPEKSLNFDAGLAYHMHKEDVPVGFDVEATYYRNSTDALIQFLQTSQFTIKAQNLSKALIQGVEFSGRVNWSERLNSYVVYTYQLAKDDSNLPATSGKFLPGRPRHELGVGATWVESWCQAISTKLFGDLRYMGGNYLDTQNLSYIDHRTLIGAGVGVGLYKKFELLFAVKNILNERISDLVGYPLPGRSYWVSANLNI